MKELMKQLQDPPKEYRAVPFWSWNDKLDPEFLQWQIREMDKAGIGGYFMHARGGLETEYMGEEWMQCIQACVEQGNESGMHSWFYDEEGWPSGFAGGVVTGLGDQYHVRWLELEAVQNELPVNDVLGLYYLHKPSGDLKNVKSFAQFPDSGEIEKYVVRHKSNPYYIDILNKDVIKAFIDSTYEKYYERFGAEFGKGLKGFFTDEPQYARNKTPWSYILPDAFQQKYGYSIVDVLPALFIQCNGFEKIRYDFWSLVNELYVSSFGKQIYEWCNEHNCKFTGHVMLEDNLFAQMSATAGVMPFYEYMHTPGIDWLGRHISSPVLPKQVGSVANQLGKKFVLTETFALCGWNVSFEELKWIAEWQYVNGINLMCQHLQGYTLRGLRKRDYPPSLFYQQSWWEEYKFFNDYFARLGMLLTSGKCAVDVLLLHPIKSAYIAYTVPEDPMEQLHTINDDFISATETLSALHIDHHYGDETIMRSHGAVADGALRIGQCSYKAVILPSMLTLDDSTVSLLTELIRQGGTVLSIGEFPVFCGGWPSSELDALKEKVICLPKTADLKTDKDLLECTVKKLELQSISISEGHQEIGSIHYQQKDLGATQLFFLVNHGQTESYDTTVTLKGHGSIKKYSAENAEVTDMEFWHEENCTKTKLSFSPMQSHILLLDATDTEAKNSVDTEIIAITPAEELKIAKCDDNALTLDYCQYSIDSGDWAGPIPIINLMDQLLNRQKNCDIALKFVFEASMDLAQNQNFFLVMEDASEFDIIVNDAPIPYVELGWWKDSSFKKIDIKPKVQNGTNTIILKRKFWQSQKVYDVLFGENVLETEKNKLTFDVELESIYLVGDFGVFSKSDYTDGERNALFTDGPFVITDMPSRAKTGDLTQQGFCFFAGSISLEQGVVIHKKTDQKYVIQLEKLHAPLMKVFVNGQMVQLLPWAPYTVDVTNYIREGSNTIILELFASNRNLLGPHHNFTGESHFVGPSTFTDKPGWADGDKKDIWRDYYCFVKFGI